MIIRAYTLAECLQDIEGGHGCLVHILISIESTVLMKCFGESFLQRERVDT